MEKQAFSQLQQDAFDHLLKGRYRMALPLAEELINKNKESSDACLCYAWALLENNDPINAEKYLRLSEELTDISMHSKMYRAYLQMRLSSFEEAIYNFNMVEGKQKELLAWSYLNKAKSLAAIGETEKANNFFMLALMIDNNANPEWKQLKKFFAKIEELSKKKNTISDDFEKELEELCKQALQRKEFWFAIFVTNNLLSKGYASKEIELLNLEAMIKLNQFNPALEKISELKNKYPESDIIPFLENKVKAYQEKLTEFKNSVETPKSNSLKTQFLENGLIKIFSLKVFDYNKDSENQLKTYYQTVNIDSISEIGIEIIFNNNFFKKNDQKINCFIAWYLDDDLIDQSGFVLEIPVDYDAMYLTRSINTKKNKFWSNGVAKVEVYVNKVLAGYKEFLVGNENAEEQPELLNDSPKTKVDEVDLQQILTELNNIVGLSNVKKSVNELIDYLDFMRERKQLGLKAKDQVTVHSIFLGNPGTGKTTVARLMGKIFKGMGLLPKGEVIEVDRSALVGQYVGETAQKTEKIIEQAIGNVLFVDEAYTLVKKGASNDFGQEAIDVLLKRMEDKKGEFFVIVAGYPKEMQDFLDANPGLRSRFTHNFTFDDYQPEELLEIFKKLIKEEDYRISDDAEKALLKELTNIYRARDKNFGNARTVRKLFEDAKLEVSKRYLSLAKHEKTQEKLTTIYPEDIKAIIAPVQAKKEAKLPINDELLNEALSQLEKLQGLAAVKKEVREMIKLANYYNEIGENIRDKFTSHILFLGSPGTGKTTVARIISKIYTALAILPNGQLIEADRSSLVASYIGQTAEKTTQAINSSMGGTLFIDEAYTLVKGGDNDFGKEAIDTLLKRMEDDRGKFIVIAAGYTDEMKSFLESNPGMKSRFTKTFFFEDYTPDDLLDIFATLCKKESLRLDEQSKTILTKYFYQIYRNRDKNFGNARIVRNIFDGANKRRTLRLTEIPSNEITEEIKLFFKATDFEDIQPQESVSKSQTIQGDKDKLEDYLAELNKLTGLDSVKDGVSKLVSSLKIAQMRKERGMEVIQKPLHSVFTGNPGTGKTTVARIIANIYKELGVVTKGHLVEVDRAQLVAGYSGQTAIKTDEIIQKSLGGVLFIDEAYTLSRGGGDFGQEAIDTLLKRMEDYKGQFVVIVAGYTIEMKMFMESNPGLTSRFVNAFHFEDYNPDQLLSIVGGMGKANGYVFDESGTNALKNKLEHVYNKRDKNFGNARTARNILLEIITNQEERISGLLDPSDLDLQLLKEVDVIPK